MTNYREVWNDENYHYASWNKLKGVDWNSFENQRKGYKMLTFVLICLWILSILLVI